MNVHEIMMFIKHHMILIVIWFFLLIILLYSIVIHWFRKDYEISCDDAICLMNRKNALVIDIRTQDEYCSGHIINSLNIPLVDIKKNGTFFYKKIKKNPLIIVYNRTTSLSNSIRKYLNQMGCVEVYVLKEGINGWKNHELPLLLKK